MCGSNEPSGGLSAGFSRRTRLPFGLPTPGLSVCAVFEDSDGTRLGQSNVATPVGSPRLAPPVPKCRRASVKRKGVVMIERSRRVPYFLAVMCLLLVPTLASAQATIKVNDNVNFRFGLLLQTWADSAEIAADPQGYANNRFLRRIRFLVGGQIAPTVSFFYETDNPNLGKAPKALGSGFITQDAFVEWKALGATNNAFIIDAGLLLPPICRNCLESAATLLSLDYGTFSFLESAPTQNSVGRDTGVQAKGYLAGGHFEYRAGIFQGFRRAGSRNAFRSTGRIQYNLW